MIFDFEKWNIAKLCKLIDQGRLDLNPPYQRNSVWSAKAQKKLINTIRLGQPIPNFFIRRVNADIFEVVDGQQRARSILAYKCGDIKDSESRVYSELTPDEQRVFDSYHLSITMISDLGENESIEAYYALVNSSGLRVNRPEIFKAEYHDTNFLGSSAKSVGK